MDPYDFYDKNKNNNDPQTFDVYTDDSYWDPRYSNAPEQDDQWEERPRRSKKTEISGIRVALGSVCMIASFALLLVMNGKLKLEWPTGGIPEISIISAGEEENGAVYEATGSAVNIRSGPGMEYDAFSRAMQGEMLSATGQISSDGAWIEVICPENGELGWASADYMRKLT